MSTFIELEVIVKAQSKTKAIKFDPDLKKYVIFVQAPREKNKANKELIQLIKKTFKADHVEILRGETSTIKVIRISNPQKNMREDQNPNI